MSAVLEAIDLGAGYNGQAVVKDLDLEVGEGEIVALLGPNGAGKTTTLLTLAGDLPRISGNVKLFGALTKAPLHKRVRMGLGFISDDRSVIMNLSARDNLRLGGGSVDEALQHFPELESHLDRPVALLSGGQQQMVTMARTLASHPRVLLADELSLGLAPLIVARLFSAIVEAAKNGVGVLLVEQQVTHALEVADRAYVLRNGQVVMSGTSEEVKSQSSNLEAAYLADTFGSAEAVDPAFEAGEGQE